MGAVQKCRVHRTRRQVSRLGIRWTSRCGSLAQAIYSSILTNTHTTRAMAIVPQAAAQAVLDPRYGTQLLTIIPLGAGAVGKAPGIVTYGPSL
ncbi:hypothetical protein BJ170DRAFT_603265 [Xylariales sp. AK1849]|nr:hypothetical protein BJ170DRAFT_603265 [Xylariales sp. AK1849]